MNEGLSDTIGLSDRADSPYPAVFISYRRDDAAGYAGRLHDFLVNWTVRWHVFVDVDSISLGLDFDQVITRAVKESDVILALIGPRWLGSSPSRMHDPTDFVRREISAGLSADIPVVPVLIHGGTLPPASALPADLVPLLRRQAIELRDETWRTDADRLARGLLNLARAHRRRSAAVRVDSHQDGAVSDRPLWTEADPEQLSATPSTKKGMRSRGTTLRVLARAMLTHPALNVSGTLVGLALVWALAPRPAGFGGSTAINGTPSGRSVTTNTPVGTPPKGTTVSGPAEGPSQNSQPRADPNPPPTSVGRNGPGTRSGSNTRGAEHSTSRPATNREPTQGGKAPSVVPPPDPSPPKDADAPPPRTKFVRPVYPRAARSFGDVVVQATINERGRVIDAKVLRSIPDLDAAAVSAVRQWEYAPTLRNGVPVRVSLIVTITFAQN